MPFESPEVKLNSSKTFIFIYVLFFGLLLFTLLITVPWRYNFVLCLLLISYSVQVLRDLIRPKTIRFQLLTASLWRVTLNNQHVWLVLKTNVFRSAWLLSLQGCNLSTGKNFTLLLPRDAMRRAHYDQLLYLLF